MKTYKDTTFCLTQMSKKHTRIYKQVNVFAGFENFSILISLTPMKFYKGQNERFQY